MRQQLTIAIACGQLACSTALWAQDADPPPAEAAPPYFTLDYLDAYLELDSQFDQSRVRYDDRRRSGGDLRQTNRDWLVEERVGFDLSGTVIDPSFMTYYGNFSFALTQGHFDEDRSLLSSESHNSTGYLLEYDLRADLFRGHPISGSVYGLRQDDRIPRRFQPKLDVRRRGFGTSWYFADDTLPMELSYDYLETDRTGNSRDRDDEHFTDNTLRYGLQWLLSEQHTLQMSYEHATEKQDFQGSRRHFDRTRDLFIFDHQLAFGSQQQHDLRTLVRYQEESGDYARDLFDFGPQLTLRHSDSLQTRYTYQFNREEYEELRVTQHRGEFQFVHQVYNNLTTTGNAFGLWEKVNQDVETTQYGAGIDWQYNRRNPLGQLYSNLFVGFDNEHVRGDDGRRLVLNESATFIDPVAVTLRNRNVAALTVLVTDSANRRIFRQGVDYLMVQQGEWTRLSRIRTGAIADRDTVLVDYEYDTPADGDVNTIRVDFGVEQRFTGGLIPYYLFSFRHQEVDDSTGFPYSPDRTDHHRIGIKYEQKRFFLSGEFEIFDDTVDPYYGFRLDGRYTILRTPEQSLESSARFLRLFFDDEFDDRNVTILDLELDHRWQINSALSLANRVLYRYQTDSVEGDTNAVDLSAGLAYALGDLSVELSVEYDLLDLPVSKEDGFGVWLTVRRDLPNILARR